MTPRKKRRYGSKKTTTRAGKREYQKDYMRAYRKQMRELAEIGRKMLEQQLKANDIFWGKRRKKRSKKSK